MGKKGRCCVWPSGRSPASWCKGQHSRWSPPVEEPSQSKQQEAETDHKTHTQVKKNTSIRFSPTARHLSHVGVFMGMGSSLPWWPGRCPVRGTWRRRWQTWPGWSGPPGGCDPWGNPSDGRGSGHSKSSLRSVEVEDNDVKRREDTKSFDFEDQNNAEKSFHSRTQSFRVYLERHLNHIISRYIVINSSKALKPVFILECPDIFRRSSGLTRPKARVHSLDQPGNLSLYIRWLYWWASQ